MIDSPHSKFHHLYVVVRFDFPVNGRKPENSISTVKAFLSQTAAEQEAGRLREVNKDKDKGCRYEVFTTRLVT